MTLYQIIIVLGLVCSAWGAGYYFGYDNKEREISAKEIIDSLEPVKAP